MKIVKEHINEITRGEKFGFGPMGIGNVEMERRRYQELYDVMMKKECNFQWFSTRVSPLNVIHTDAAKALNCDVKDIAEVEFGSSTIFKEIKANFGENVDKFERRDRFLSYSFFIWKDPEFLICMDSASWNNYSSKLQIYLNNTKAKLFNKQ